MIKTMYRIVFKSDSHFFVSPPLFKPMLHPYIYVYVYIYIYVCVCVFSCKDTLSVGLYMSILKVSREIDIYFYHFQKEQTTKCFWINPKQMGVIISQNT